MKERKNSLFRVRWARRSMPQELPYVVIPAELSRRLSEVESLIEDQLREDDPDSIGWNQGRNWDRNRVG